MDSDSHKTITDPTESAWVAKQRESVVNYLAAQRCEHGGISLEPRWFVSPYLAVWAVRSKANPDRIGWWAISGDVPTDYLTCTDERDDADVLMAFSRAWERAASYMAKGEWAPNHRIGPEGRQKVLAPMLANRAKTLASFAKDMRTGGGE